MQSYDIAANSRRCLARGESLRPGDEYFSAIVETVAGLERQDYCPAHWPGPPADALAYWKGRMVDAPDPPSPRAMTTDELVQLFERLKASQSPDATRLLYVFSLLLVRRKVLKLVGTQREGDADYLVVTLPGEPEPTRILDPELSEEEIGGLENRLHELMQPTGP